MNKQIPHNNLRRKPRVALLLNVAPSYRSALFHRLDQSKVVKFFFSAGEYDMQVSSLMNFKELKGFKYLLKPKFSGTKLIWQKGWWRLLFEHYDSYILTANGGIRSNWLLLILARLMGRKVYLWGHGLYGNESSLTRVKNLLYMKMASGMLLYGEHGKNELIKNGYNPNKLTIIYNSLDVERQKPLRDRKEDYLFIRNYFGSDAPYVVFLGRLTPQKSLDLLINAIGVLKMQGFECNAIIIGAGSELKPLQKQCEEANVVDNVWFFGDCYDESMIATLIKGAKIMVSPGNVGLTAMHSLSYGTPVITHNRISMQMPEFEAIRNGVTGSLFRYNDVVSLSDKIYKWCKALEKEDVAERCAKKCIEVIDKRYNAEIQAKLIEYFILKNYHERGRKK